MCFDISWRSDQDDGALQLAFVFVEVGFGLGVNIDDVTAHRALGAGSPGLRVGDKRNELRRNHIRGESFERPAAAERVSFKVSVLQAPLG